MDLRLEEHTAECPYCGESITLLIDMSQGNQSYIEDCSVCCAPMVVAVSVDVQGELVDLIVNREDS